MFADHCSRCCFFLLMGSTHTNVQRLEWVVVMEKARFHMLRNMHFVSGLHVILKYVLNIRVFTVADGFQQKSAGGFGSFGSGGQRGGGDRKGAC